MSSPQLGRPRQSHIDVAALDATRDLLVELGYSRTTVQRIAERAGVSLTAIYRRWPSKLELVTDAVFPPFDDVQVQPIGDLRGDLKRFLRAFRALYGTPAARAAIPGLMLDCQALGQERLRLEQFRGQHSRGNMRANFRAVLAAAPASMVDPAIDPDDVFDLLIGSALVRTFVLGTTSRGRSPDRTVDLLCRAVAPTTKPRRRRAAS